jgi:uncharacterized protein YbgA (DUF1722 family)
MSGSPPDRQPQALYQDGPEGRRGRLVADAGKRDWDELTAEYGAMLMEGLGVMSTRGKHVNVLQHLMGYLKNRLSSEDQAYLWSVGSLWASSRTTGRGCCR